MKALSPSATHCAGVLATSLPEFVLNFDGTIESVGSSQTMSEGWSTQIMKSSRPSSLKYGSLMATSDPAGIDDMIEASH